MLNIKQLSELSTNVTVLYVEDEKDTREIVTSILKKIFANVLVAINGLDGIKISKTTKIDLIISDINMPKCNGLDMIEEIKKESPQIPTILLTALEDPKVLVKSIDLGINKYIIKPMIKDKLFEAIEEMLYLINMRNKHRIQQLQVSKNFKMIAISKLLDNITHQWRQSLSIISTACSGIMLQENEKISNDGIWMLLNQIDKTVISMDKELQDILLDFEQEHKKSIFNIKDTAQNIINLFQRQCRDDSSRIELINNIDNIEIFNSVDSFSQILHHIIENSMEALVLNQFSSRYIELSSVVKENKIIIEIVDNGGGISECIVDEIFEPYSTTKHQYIGTGLGLYISYILVTKSLNGTITGTNCIINNQKCAKLSISLTKRN